MLFPKSITCMFSLLVADQKLMCLTLSKAALGGKKVTYFLDDSYRTANRMMPLSWCLENI